MTMARAASTIPSPRGVRCQPRGQALGGGLTSVLQVCDLVANKDIKAIIKRLYLQYRAGFIRAEKAKYTDKPDKHIKMKLPIVEMMDIIEKAVVEFNTKQRETQSIKKTFLSAGQHPWQDCEKEFEEHLQKLSKLPLYGGCKTLRDNISEMQLRTRVPMRLELEDGMEEDEVEEDRMEEDDM